MQSVVAFWGQDSAGNTPSHSMRTGVGAHIPGPLNQKVLNPSHWCNKIQEICGSGYVDGKGTGRLGQRTDKNRGYRRLFAFLRGPPEQWLPPQVPEDEVRS